MSDYINPFQQWLVIETSAKMAAIIVTGLILTAIYITIYNFIRK